MLQVLHPSLKLTNSKAWTKVLRNVKLLSYLSVNSKYNLMNKTVGDILDEAAKKYGDRIAYHSVYQNQKVTFQEAKEQADALAAGLLECGLEKGDRVGVYAPNSLEWYISSFAMAKAGVISVYLNPIYQALELQHCLNAVGMKMLITTEGFRKMNYFEIFDQFIPELSTSEPGQLKSVKVPSLKSVVCISDKTFPGCIPYKSIFEKNTESSRKKLMELSKTIDPDDPCNIQFTSGTTGAPKGAVLTHFGIVNNSHLCARRQDFDQKHHTMCFMGPLFHILGSVCSVLLCLYDGVTLVIPETSFSASKSAEAILSEKCTILVGTPTMFIDVMNFLREKGVKPRSIEVAISGGAFASIALFKNIMKNLGVKRVASVYGMTESSPVSFMSQVTDDIDKATSTVGSVMDLTEVKVVDNEGHIVPWNTAGELWVRGYCVMRGYWNEEAKTKNTITPAHWLKTGDQFTLSEDGYGRVVGRIKDLIIRGGENIYPADVEEFLSNHPAILEVQVIGLPDKRLGEQVCACIRLKPHSKLTENELKKYCEGKIASFKVPHYVYFTDKFPRTASGKVQKYKLTTQARGHFKLDEEET